MVSATDSLEASRMIEPSRWIRHLAAASMTERIAAARFEREVAIWDLSTRQRTSAFDTVLDFGGRRLALTPDGSRCIAGAYSRRGIACYNASNGGLVWRRPDLTGVQYISVSPDGKRVFCGFGTGPCVVLDVESGETLERWRGVRRVIGSPFMPVYLTCAQRY